MGCRITLGHCDGLPWMLAIKEEGCWTVYFFETRVEAEQEATSLMDEPPIEVYIARVERQS